MSTTQWLCADLCNSKLWTVADALKRTSSFDATKDSGSRALTLPSCTGGSTQNLYNIRAFARRATPPRGSRCLPSVAIVSLSGWIVHTGYLVRTMGKFGRSVQNGVRVTLR
jgi:hypothetical protein